MTTTSILSLKPLTSTHLPASLDVLKDDILKASTQLIASLADHNPTTSPWSKSSTVYNRSECLTTARSSSKKPDRIVPGSGVRSHRWHSRTSTHTHSFEDFRYGLLKDHSVHEQNYIDSCSEAKLLQVLEAGVLEIWHMSYKLPFPTSNRDFVLLILTIDTSSSADGLRSFQVVSIPIEHPDCPRRTGFVRGKYVSVEDVRENSDGTVIWRMATASDAGGDVPQFVTELAMQVVSPALVLSSLMLISLIVDNSNTNSYSQNLRRPSKISEDVPAFLKWIHHSRNVAGVSGEQSDDR